MKTLVKIFRLVATLKPGMWKCFFVPPSSPPYPILHSYTIVRLFLVIASNTCAITYRQYTYEVIVMFSRSLKMLICSNQCICSAMATWAGKERKEMNIWKSNLIVQCIFCHIELLRKRVNNSNIFLSQLNVCQACGDS